MDCRQKCQRTDKLLNKKSIKSLYNYFITMTIKYGFYCTREAAKCDSGLVLAISNLWQQLPLNKGCNSDRRGQNSLMSL